MTGFLTRSNSAASPFLIFFIRKGLYFVIQTGALICLLLLVSACTAIPESLGQNLQSTFLPALGLFPQTSPTSTSQPGETSLPNTAKPLPTRTATEPAGDGEKAPSATTTPTFPAPTSQPPVVIPLTDTVSEYSETSDLLYLDGDKLMRWDHVTNYSSLLVDGVKEYDLSGNGDQIAILKKTNMSANGQEIYNLGVFNFETKQLNYLVESLPGMFDISISPDGGMVIYNKESPTAEIYIVKNEPNPEPELLGVCIGSLNRDCRDFSWSPDSQKVVWSNPNGIWMAEIADLPGYLLHPNTITVTDPKGEQEQIEVEYRSFNWSPGSRFVLVDVIPSDYGVRWQGVLDSSSGQIVKIPQSIDYSELEACANWTREGDLMVGHSVPAPDESAPRIVIWKIIPTKTELLVKQQEIQLEPKIFPTVTAGEEGEGLFFPNWLNQVDNTTFNFGLCKADSDLAPVLYRLDTGQNELEEIVVIPNNTTDILWTPDGSGALILGRDGELIYTPFDGSLMRDLREILGEGAHEFNWLPPKPRM